MMRNNDKLAGSEQPVTEVDRARKAGLIRQEAPAGPGPSSVPSPTSPPSLENWIVTIPEPTPVRVRAMLARTITVRAGRRLALEIMPDEGLASVGVPPVGDVPVLLLLRPESFYRRLGSAGLIGFGEAFQAGDWESNDLPRMLSV